MAGTFQNGLCGCCNNKNVCLLGCCLPCYAMGKTAEVVDQNCILFGLLALTPFNLCAGTYVRSLVREKYSIEGSIVTDFLAHCCCACCAIIQEAQVYFLLLMKYFFFKNKEETWDQGFVERYL